MTPIDCFEADLTMTSPNGGPVVERNLLADRYAHLISVKNDFSRKLVSYQGNRKSPGLRWMKYKEGFSRQLVSDIIEQHQFKDVLDPFAGIGTTALVAAGKGGRGTGIEIMPVGVLAGKAIASASNGVSAGELDRESRAVLRAVRSCKGRVDDFAFPHVPITIGAFPRRNEVEISAARSFLPTVDNSACRQLLELACMSVLEESSYTRKDGQYLRWDRRAGRSLKSNVDKGPVSAFNAALDRRLSEMLTDIDQLKHEYGRGYPDLVAGSCLELLKDIPPRSFDAVITSPPYANRYDYTRTYALELAWLGFDRQGFSELRQRLLSATVENKEKTDWLRGVYRENPELLNHAIDIHRSQGALHEVLGILSDRQQELSNRNVLRLIFNYFLEMALVIVELGRIVRPGGVVIMVNDNVQYHGEELPVDFILSDFAEQSGFECTDIWKLARGKGNSSQQMARFGRRELRKCVYKWVRSGV